MSWKAMDVAIHEVLTRLDLDEPLPATETRPASQPSRRQYQPQPQTDQIEMALERRALRIDSRRRRALLHLRILLCCLLVALVSEFAKANDKLRADLEAVINGPDYKQAQWGLLVVDLESGQTVYERDADKLFMPASTTKLYSVAAALDALGADYRFETPVYYRGDLNREGVLKGDLILVASGDLTLGGRTDQDGHIAFKNGDHTYEGELTDPDPLAGLNELARQVAAAGIKRVKGDVLVDDRLFDPAPSSGSGPRRVSPILVNDNVLDFLITPGSTGAPAAVTWRPETLACRVDAQVETVEAGKEAAVEVTSAGGGRYIVRGQIPAGHAPLLRIAEVEEPASHARSLFIEALTRAGVRVDASCLTANRSDQLPPRDLYRRLRRVALLKSPPFAESIRLILKVSHNLHASTLPLLVAARKGKHTLQDGLRLQREFLARAGIEVDTISFGGGAGGSTADFTTPRATVQLLRFMSKHRDFGAYEAALPVLGVDGTLASAVDASSPARGKVRAKTGSFPVWDPLNDRLLLKSKALAGYLTTAKGRRLAFAFFVNNAPLPKGVGASREGRILGKLCEIIYTAE